LIPSASSWEPSSATTNARSLGGQFVVLRGNTYDGHTLKAAVETVEAWTGVTVKRIYVGKGIAAGR
jgi:hypothetical protein